MTIEREKEEKAWGLVQAEVAKLKATCPEWQARDILERAYVELGKLFEEHRHEWLAEIKAELFELHTAAWNRLCDSPAYRGYYVARELWLEANDAADQADKRAEESCN